MMAMSDSKSENKSIEVNPSGLKENIHALSKKELMPVVLSLINEIDRLSVDNDQLMNSFSSVKLDSLSLLHNNVELENQIKDLKEQIHVLKTENATFKLENLKSNEVLSNDKGLISEIQIALENELKGQKKICTLKLKRIYYLKRI